MKNFVEFKQGEKKDTNFFLGGGYWLEKKKKSKRF